MDNEFSQIEDNILEATRLFVGEETRKLKTKQDDNLDALRQDIERLRSELERKVKEYSDPAIASQEKLQNDLAELSLQFGQKIAGLEHELLVTIERRVKESAFDGKSVTTQVKANFKALEDSTKAIVARVLTDTISKFSENQIEATNLLSNLKENVTTKFGELEAGLNTSLTELVDNSSKNITEFHAATSEKTDRIVDEARSAILEAVEAKEQLRREVEADKAAFTKAIADSIDAFSVVAREAYESSIKGLEEKLTAEVGTMVSESHETLNRHVDSLNDTTGQAKEFFDNTIEDLKKICLEQRQKDFAEFTSTLHRIADLEVKARSILADYENIKLESRTLPSPINWTHETNIKSGQLYRYKSGLFMWIGLNTDIGVEPGTSDRWRCVVDGVHRQYSEIKDDQLSIIVEYSSGQNNVTLIPIPHHCGVWSKDRTYKQFSLVSKNNVIWCAVAPNVGTEPGTSREWTAWSIRGPKGKNAPRIKEVTLEKQVLLFHTEDEDVHPVDISGMFNQLKVEVKDLLGNPVEVVPDADDTVPLIRTRGAFNIGQSYIRGDVVRLGTTLWVATASNDGVVPSSQQGNDVWSIVFGTSSGGGIGTDTKINSLYITADDRADVPFAQLQNGLMVFQLLDQTTWQFYEGGWTQLVDSDGEGGGGTGGPELYMSVANDAARLALPSEVKLEGLVVYQTADNKIYMWEESAWRAVVWLTTAPNAPVYLSVVDQAARLAISSPLDGLMVYQRSDNTLWRWEDTVWKQYYWSNTPILPVLYRSVPSETERLALTGIEGLLIYQTVDDRSFRFENGTWREVLPPLTLDDPIYLPAGSDVWLSVRQALDDIYGRTENVAYQSDIQALAATNAAQFEMIQHLQSQIDLLVTVLEANDIQVIPPVVPPGTPSVPDAEATVTINLVQSPTGNTSLAIANDKISTHPTVDMKDDKPHRIRFIYGSGITRASFIDTSPSLYREDLT